MQHKAVRSGLARPHVVRRAPKRAAFTIAEVAMAAAVLTIAVGGLLSSIVASMALNRVNNETGLAQAYARRAIERLQGVPFAEIFATFNADPNDDPAGPGTAPGARFDAFGLAPAGPAIPGVGALAGEIIFPVTTIGTAQQLREDVVDAALGMPRDLNGDGLPPDGMDHAGDYKMLPVRVRVQ